MLDGKPIVAIATGLDNQSSNSKTGSMVQVWILRDDVDPITASKRGDDKSICGSCPHMGVSEYVSPELGFINKGRTCYVTLFHAPRNVWASYKRGIYDHATPEQVRVAFTGKRIRLGAYGDPAAVPLYVWHGALARADAFTGYTHQWRTCPRAFARYVMASADSHSDAIEARKLGYRLFRVTADTNDKLAGEVRCPASKEAGYKTNCASCVACGGTSAKAKADIVIVVHGAGAKNFALA
jgi:hypothetical protein